MTTDETEDGKRNSLGTILIVVIVFLAVAYVLSCGPVLWLREHGYLPSQARIVYWPLDELAIRSELAGTALEWYAELWVGPPPP